MDYYYTFSQPVRLTGRLLTDLASTSVPLVPGIEVKIQIALQKDSFVLLCGNGNQDPENPE